jgi:hypothetical protein
MRQVSVELTISSDMFDGVFMVSLKLANDSIIGSRFLLSRRVLRTVSQTNKYQESVGKQSSTFPAKFRITPTRMRTAASLKVVLFTQIILRDISVLCSLSRI